MITSASLRAQRGATLVVGLIMLVLITLMVTSAFVLSTGNLRAVGNMQFRSEAIAAANMVVEQVLASPFTSAPTAQSDIEVDINNDGNIDYLVDIAQPTCIRATIALPANASSISLGPAMSTASHWNTVWDIDAEVNDPVSGASIKIRQGVRVLLLQSQKNLVCA
jgi:Tfp pilus assembly protein PilX